MFMMYHLISFLVTFHVTVIAKVNVSMVMHHLTEST